MSYKVVKYLPFHKNFIDLRDYDNSAFVKESFDFYAETGTCFTLIDSKAWHFKVIALGGIMPKFTLNSGIGWAWIAAQQDLSPYKFTFAKKVKKELASIAKKMRYHRVETLVRTDHPEAARFIEWLGFDKEGLLKQGLPGKIDCYSYSKIIK